MSLSRALALGACMIGATFATSVAANQLPPATVKMLDALKLEHAILDGIDAELQVPPAWLDAAKKEGPVILFDTMRPQDFAKVYSVFSARYPDVRIEHSEVHTSTRRYIMPLAAFEQGRRVVDVIMSLSGNVALFRAANAFENLSDLPNYKHLPEFSLTPDHISINTRLRYWCMSYNTKLVKKEDLPKTWDDLVSSKVFAGKKLMIGNRPNNWVLGLWETHGDAWGRNFVNDVFAKLDPQIRKEGLNALVRLVSLGEGHAAVPQAMNRVGSQARVGAPVGFHCPEPVTFALSEAGLMRNSPSVNGAKIFLNWFISREGQIAQFWADQSTPVRKELQRKEFLDFPDAVADKRMVTSGEPETRVRLQKYWDARWQSMGGTVSTSEAE